MIVGNISGTAKFKTACGRTFDSNVALAEYLGVDKSSVSHAVCDAKAKGRMFFECGKPHKRCVTMLKPNVASDNEKDEICNLQSFAYNACGKTNKNTENTQFDTCVTQWYKEEGILLKAMQVHTHLQAASLKLFPERKLRLLQINDSKNAFKINNFSVSCKQEKSGSIKFNVAHTWYVHAEQNDLYWCFQQVDASISNKVLKTDTYPSLLVFDLPKPSATGKTAYLNAEDMLKFLQHCLNIFEDQPKNMQEEAELEAPSSPPTYEESCQSKYENITTPPLRRGFSERKRTFEATFEETCATAAADEFMTICDKVMQNVNEAVLYRQELAGLATDKDSIKKSKTNLACDSVRNMTSVLLAANKFLYAASKEF